MKKSLLAVSLGIFLSSTVSAAVMTYENRLTDAGVNKNDYLSSWNAQSSAINTQNLSSFSNLRAAGNNRHSHLSVSFDVSAEKAGQDWLFQVAPDAGLGGAMYMDNALIDQDASNLWWGYSWNRTSEILGATVDQLMEGSYKLDVYWAENCCNGAQAARFSVDQGSTWMALSTDNLNAVGVPEPGSVALLGLGVVGLMAARRKQK
jgi:hypothetical protein